MARNSTNIAQAIGAVNEIVSDQATVLAQIIQILQTKAAGSGASLFGQIYDSGAVYPISGVTVTESNGIVTIGG